MGRIPALSALLLCVLAVAAGIGGRCAGGDGAESRRVLGIYNGRVLANADPGSGSLHTLLEMPLNHLGMALDYADINDPLPDAKPYRAVIVWLDSHETPRAEQLLPWLLETMGQGVKVILPDGLRMPYPPGGDPVHENLVYEVLAKFGLAPAAYAMNGRLEDYRFNILRPELFSFETDLINLDNVSPVMHLTVPRSEPWLRIEDRADPEIHGVGVVVGPAGLWAVSGNLLHYSLDVPNQGYRVAWNIDPFAMLEAALDLAGHPRPDVTTFWGARGAYSHVDVDGPSNMTQPDMPGPSRFALEAVFEEVWKKYPYPVSLGWIAADYDPDIDLRFIMPGETPQQTLARDRLEWEKPHRETATALRKLVEKICALPTIQSGCHAYSHPLNWRRLTPGFAIRDYAPSYEMEVRGAVEYLNNTLLPPDKPVTLYHWSGDCDPPEEALAILDEMGMANINGGDPLYDARHNSVYFVCALSRPKGKYRQIYSSGSNENIYTNGWTGFKGAFNNVVATFERSEKPRRLLPVDIYYHVFPAERLAGCLAIQHAYDWAAGQELCWMTAVEYVRAANAFFPVRYGGTGDGGWWIEEYGECGTLRFDREGRGVDMAASRNVAGYFHANGSLYVSLLPGARAEVRLGEGRPDRPCLARASGVLSDIAGETGSWRATVRGWGPGFIELWAPDGPWTATATSADGARREETTRRLPDGRIRFTFPDQAGQLLEVSFHAD